ncbi:unnamed protein product [Didymodactylos carnosus]|uniref:Hexosyltransferase n=2 Tax=Didymodactylos carnosus TaxID=1234261 RepID=A0A8S2CZ50_9BILA|nr:unnamed protein product [Didymodactylos carnosus]CAF3624761.1 unnamed protein product [Didymodactylos carnosus]
MLSGLYRHLPTPIRRYRSYVKCFLIIIIMYMFCNIVGIGRTKNFEQEYGKSIKYVDIFEIAETDQHIGGPYINQLPNTFIISNEKLCSKPPYLLIMVKSAIGNYLARKAIRLTWGSHLNKYKKSIKLAFVLGTHSHNSTIEKESAEYQDIIQIDKTDYYYYNSCRLT